MSPGIGHTGGGEVSAWCPIIPILPTRPGVVHDVLPNTEAAQLADVRGWLRRTGWTVLLVLVPAELALITLDAHLDEDPDRPGSASRRRGFRASRWTWEFRLWCCCWPPA